MTKRPANKYERYHAHVYFGATSLEKASLLCEAAGKRFGVSVGRIHQRLVGPHPRWSCQLSFDKTQFDSLIPWLENNRDGLTILVHALTGNDLADHTEHASWLGEAVPLKLSIFDSQSEGSLQSEASSEAEN
ncbi:MAG: DOPA 4,5-dioxygenase family protein [Microcoleaceae cyanobacterium]